MFAMGMKGMIQLTAHKACFKLYQLHGSTQCYTNVEQRIIVLQKHVNLLHQELCGEIK